MFAPLSENEMKSFSASHRARCKNFIFMLFVGIEVDSQVEWRYQEEDEEAMGAH